MSINITFTTETQQLLVALGFVHKHHPAEWKDVGGPENGPKLVGHREYDAWNKGDTSVYVADGVIVEVEKIQLNPELFPF